MFSFPIAGEVAGRPSSKVSVLSTAFTEMLHTVPERSRPDSPDPHGSAVTEMFISGENISKMDNILDTWSNNLKVCYFPSRHILFALWLIFF